MMLDKLQSKDFQPFLHEIFLIGGDLAEPMQAELIDVTDLGGDPASGSGIAERRAFSVVLRGPERPVLPQHIYAVEHPVLGKLHLFLVPIGPDRSGMRYEAIFG